MYRGAGEGWATQLSRYGYWCQTCCPVTFAVFFLFWQDMKALMRLGTRSCFLDKFCIHQTNPERKAAGILGLAGFLRCSDRFIVLWTPRYFTRLWCTYEVASWLHLQKPLRSVLLMPLAHAQLIMTFMTGWCCGCVFATLSLFVLPTRLFMVAVLLGCFTVLSVGAHQARRCTRHLSSLSKQLESFSVTSSHCYCCSIEHKRSGGEEVPCDREVVYATIASWFGGFNGLEREHGPSQASVQSQGISRTRACQELGEEVALSRFDEAVRTMFAPKVLAKAGPTKLSYRYAILGGWPFLFRGCDLLSAADQLTPTYRRNAVVVCPTMALAAAPVFYKLAMHLTCLLDNHVGIPAGCLADYLLTLALGAAYLLLMLLIWYPLEILAWHSTAAWPMSIAALAYTVAALSFYHEDIRDLLEQVRLCSTSDPHDEELARHARIHHHRPASQDLQALAKAYAGYTGVATPPTVISNTPDLGVAEEDLRAIVEDFEVDVEPSKSRKERGRYIISI